MKAIPKSFTGKFWWKHENPSYRQSCKNRAIEELMELNANLLTEVRKPRYFSTSGLLKRAGLPVASQAVERKYMGLSSPTLLKFKREDVNDNKK